MTTYFPIFSGIFRGGDDLEVAEDLGAGADMTRAEAKKTDRIRSAPTPHCDANNTVPALTEGRDLGQRVLMVRNDHSPNARTQSRSRRLSQRYRKLREVCRCSS